MKTEAVLSLHMPFSTAAPASQVPSLDVVHVARPTSPVEAILGFVLLTLLSLPGAVLAWVIMLS